MSTFEIGKEYPLFKKGTVIKKLIVKAFITIDGKPFVITEYIKHGQSRYITAEVLYQEESGGELFRIGRKFCWSAVTYKEVEENA